MAAHSQLTRKLPPIEKLTQATAKDFRGGLNTFDTPLNLSSRYAIDIRNLYPDTNGRLRLRFGTSKYADVAAYIDVIVNIEYFAAAIIVVGANGVVVSVNAAGVATVRFDTAIAAALPGAPAGWSTDLTFVSFAQFGGDLIICNGVDKPIIMDEVYTVTYLQDLGTGSNVNVPRARYCITHNNYLVLSFTPTDESTLYITSKGTSGTFVGDPGVDNDAVDFATNTYTNRGSPAITGLGSFRGKLIVTFAENIMAIALGEYDSGGIHIPRVDDTIENHGAISHRCIVPLGDDILFMDQAGVESIQRALITGTLSPVRESALIATDLQRAMAKFTPQQLSDSIFAVHDRIQQHILFCIPKTTTVDAVSDNDIYVYCFDKSQKFRAWAHFDQMAYRCATRSTEGRVFFGAGTLIYYYRNQFEPLYNDYATNTAQLWSDATLWDDGTPWVDESGTIGLSIPYSLTLPWADFHKPTLNKLSKYITLLLEGAGSFTVDMYTDSETTPSLSMLMTQTIDPASSTDVLRPSNNEQLYAWTQKFRRMKLRISGSSSNYIAIIAISIMYLLSGARR